jgi:2-desacetyl-2-hydroxyethyl bacteriochlorophyllide A dehydrogenase
MKAMLFYALGGPEVLRLEEVPTPQPKAGEVLVRVRACGVNRLDILVREGISPTPPARVTLPHISGSEVAGEIVAFADSDDNEHTSLRIGQRVVIAPYLCCGTCRLCLRGEEGVCPDGDILGLFSNGGFAEYVVAPVASLVPIPDGVGFEAAAAVTLAALTARHMVVARGRVQPGEEVLVMAAGSGVGSAAIQIANLCGARVIASAGSDAKLERAYSLGADATVNYSSGSYANEVKRLTGGRGVDVVVEHIGSPTWTESMHCLAVNGRLLTSGAMAGKEGQVDIWDIFNREYSIIGSTGGNREELRQVLQMVQWGRLQPVIHGVYPLTKLAEAQAVLSDRSVFGKVLVRP